jgi:hyaluronan synthase
MAAHHSLPIVPSWWRQFINTVLCLLTFTTIFLYFRRYVSSFPITLESVWQISLAEVNRRKNVQRIKNIKRGAADEELGFGEKQPVVRHMSSVVGYREEPVLFKKCLQSYRGTPGLEVMLVGIDGDSSEDMEMVRIAQEVSRIACATLSPKLTQRHRYFQRQWSKSTLKSRLVHLLYD